MLRQAFVTKLKPGALATSTDQHDHPWPELAMEPLMEFGPGGKVDARFVKQVFNFDA